MLKENELRSSLYYFRWYKADKDGSLIEVSIEDYLLTQDFIDYMKKNGYVQKAKEKGRRTTHFVPKGS